MVPIESGDDSGISIENIVYGGATHFLKKSLYYYTGSLTTPFC
jgi:carbonic anhydrase